MSLHRSLRLAIGASVLVPGIHPDDELLVSALRSRGYDCQPVIWNDAGVDWGAFDALLIRSIWDYFQHYAQYLRWLDELDRLALPTLNPLEVLRWNSNKRYLLELPSREVAIIPTRLASGRDLTQHLAAMQGQEIVIKPTVSGTAWHTVRGLAGSADLAAAIAKLPADFEYLVQPFMPQIAAEGEWSLIFFDGEFSHAVLKRPVSGDYRVQNEFGGTAASVEPSPQIMDSARRAVRAVRALGHDGCYARIDGVWDGAEFLIMEVEMIEPSLFFGGNARAAERFAEVIDGRLAALRGSGL